MPALKAFSWQRNIESFQKIILALDNAKRPIAAFAIDNFVYDGFGRIFDMIRHFVPWQGHCVLTAFSLSPRIALRNCLFFGEEEVVLRDSFIVTKRRHADWKKLPIHAMIASGNCVPEMVNNSVIMCC